MEEKEGNYITLFILLCLGKTHIKKWFLLVVGPLRGGEGDSPPEPLMFIAGQYQSTENGNAKCKKILYFQMNCFYIYIW